jgi:RNA polymerase sigma factor (sigma-70 family)
MSIPETQTGGEARSFPATSWTVVARLRDRSSAERRELLERLIADYWKPVYCLVRQSWARSNEDAKDLTQSFFLNEVVEGSLLERYDPDRGNFRSFLKGALAAFLRRSDRDAGRQKRGGDARVLRLDVGDADLSRLVPDAQALTPEQLFDRAWKRVVLDRAVRLLEKRMRSMGREPYFDVFRRYDLEGSDTGASYKSVGAALGLEPDTVKNYLTRAREEYMSAVREIVGEYVEDPEQVSRELDTLFEA